MTIMEGELLRKFGCSCGRTIHVRLEKLISIDFYTISTWHHGMRCTSVPLYGRNAEGIATLVIQRTRSCFSAGGPVYKYCEWEVM